MPRAEKCFHRAIDTARRQNAKSLELRAAVSLCELLIEEDNHKEAEKLLSKTTKWFKEGLDTLDFISAKKLLSELKP